ncbi:hypothetical protein ON010_g6855 [Phytophthora cinnamomi]|nr:hypothetical protein ON010_g6855 [Phytophthora cinnamomi]
MSTWHVKADFAQLLQAPVTPHIGLDESPSHLAPASKNLATVRLDPELLYVLVPSTFEGHVLSFDGSAKTAKNGGNGNCSWVVWCLPAWDIEIAASAYLPSTTGNIAEYTGMNDIIMAELSRGIADLIISGRVVLSNERKAELKVLNRILEVLYAEADSAEPKAEMAVMTRNQSRRVHVEDVIESEASEVGRSGRSRRKYPLSLSPEAGNNEYESEKPLRESAELKAKRKLKPIMTAYRTQLTSTRLWCRQNGVDAFRRPRTRS